MDILFVSATTALIVYSTHTMVNTHMGQAIVMVVILGSLPLAYTLIERIHTRDMANKLIFNECLGLDSLRHASTHISCVVSYTSSPQMQQSFEEDMQHTLSGIGRAQAPTHDQLASIGDLIRVMHAIGRHELGVRTLVRYKGVLHGLLQCALWGSEDARETMIHLSTHPRIMDSFGVQHVRAMVITLYQMVATSFHRHDTPINVSNLMHISRLICGLRYGLQVSFKSTIISVIIPCSPWLRGINPQPTDTNEASSIIVKSELRIYGHQITVLMIHCNEDFLSVPIIDYVVLPTTQMADHIDAMTGFNSDAFIASIIKTDEPIDLTFKLSPLNTNINDQHHQVMPLFHTALVISPQTLEDDEHPSINGPGNGMGTLKMKGVEAGYATLKPHERDQPIRLLSEEKIQDVLLPSRTMHWLGKCHSVQSCRFPSPCTFLRYEALIIKMIQEDLSQLIVQEIMKEHGAAVNVVQLVTLRRRIPSTDIHVMDEAPRNIQSAVNLSTWVSR